MGNRQSSFRIVVVLRRWLNVRYVVGCRNVRTVMSRLRYTKSINLLTCHYCGYTYPVPTECPNCGSTEIMGRGFGTEKIEDQIAEIFPEAKIARMDLDTTRTRNAYERLIADFSEGRTNLLIGTQMVSKGLDFDKGECSRHPEC